jgi:hypothetical protein
MPESREKFHEDYPDRRYCHDCSEDANLLATQAKSDNIICTPSVHKRMFQLCQNMHVSRRVLVCRYMQI